ncbi:MAG: OB-fold putative lipoprotein [Deltaproteobacteria bacterium]|nr:OB-fold putative lipoprotein [Deltaproteobacteria bacterium]
MAGLTLSLALAWALGWGPAAEPAQAVTYGHQPALAVCDAYEQDAVAADAKYKNTYLKVQGKVQRVGRDFYDRPFVTISCGGTYLLGIKCLLAPAQQAKWTHLREGQNIYLRGICRGRDLDIIIDECNVKR